MGASRARIEHVSLRAFVHATEERARVERALFFVAGTPPDDGKVLQQMRKGLAALETRGHAGNPITILELTLSAQRLITHFVGRALSGSIPATLRRELQRRLDDDLVLYARFDKQDAYEGRLTLSAGEDVIHARLKVATYPKRRETAEAFLDQLLSP